MIAQDSVRLGPVERDSSVLSIIAKKQFLRDSLEAVRKTDSAIATVASEHILVFPRQEKPANTELVPSMFSGHALQPQNQGLIPVDRTPGWVHLTLIFILFLAAFINWRYPSRIRTILNAVILNRFLGQLIREENVYLNRVTILLSAMFMLAVALFLMLTLDVFGWKLPLDLNPFGTFIFICGCILAAFIVKIAAVRIAGAIFALDKAANEYAFSILLYNQVAGLFLIPVLLGMAYLEVADPAFFAWSGAILMAGFYLFRLFRVVTGGLASPSVSLYYLFLYLCTLEFLPVAVAVKLIFT